MSILSSKITWSLFGLGVIALGLSINQLNKALDQSEGRDIPAEYVVTTSTPTIVTPTTTPTKTPPVTIPPTSTLSVSAIVAAASTWNNRQVCIEGNYQNSFEFTALAQSVSPKGYLQKPYIWVEVPVDENELTCKKNQVGQVTCTGSTTICGIFQAAAEGAKGYGHVSAYRYQLISPTKR